MAENMGKKFETIVKDSFEKCEDTVVVRLHDQMNGFSGSKNPCDFIVFNSPYFYAIECKTVHGNTLPFTNITDFQWSELLKMSNKKHVHAGILCWWVDKDVTRFIPISVLDEYQKSGMKSIRWDDANDRITDDISGKKKRTFFDYDMTKFFKECSWIRNRN